MMFRKIIRRLPVGKKTDDESILWLMLCDVSLEVFDWTGVFPHVASLTLIPPPLIFSVNVRGFSFDQLIYTYACIHYLSLIYVVRSSKTCATENVIFTCLEENGRDEVHIF
jgi:hypothetical protein